MDFTTLPVLSDERLGAAVVGRNDEFFALADNLLKAEPPIFVADRFTKRGKWMDGWETRRRRTPGVDWCIIRLGAPGVVRGIVVDTVALHRQLPEGVLARGLLGRRLPVGRGARRRRVDAAGTQDGRSPATSKHLVNVSLPARITHVRLTISPDGGVARLRVHGEPVPDPRDVWGMPLDLAALEHGGVVIDCSDMYFSHRHNLNLPTSPTSMADGWETRRRRGPGNDWVVVRLVQEGVLRIAEVDTRFFKGNAPGSFSLEGRSDGRLARADGRHRPAARTCGTGSGCRRTSRSPTSGSTSIPDGGIARLRLWGALSEHGAEALGLRWLDTLPLQPRGAGAADGLRVARWAREMAARPLRTPIAGRPAGGRGLGVARPRTATTGWRPSPRTPGIGERSGPAGSAGAWARQEQAGTAGADAGRARGAGGRQPCLRGAVRPRLPDLVRPGCGADEMLAALRSRRGNDPETELTVAGRASRRRSRLRLEKLLTPMTGITTHVLDTSTGRPAAGIEAQLLAGRHAGSPPASPTPTAAGPRCPARPSRAATSSCSRPAPTSAEGVPPAGVGGLHRARPGRAPPRPAAALAVRLHHLPRQLTGEERR